MPTGSAPRRSSPLPIAPQKQPPVGGCGIPQSIGSAAEALRGRLQPSSRSKQDRLRKGAATERVSGDISALQDENQKTKMSPRTIRRSRRRGRGRRTRTLKNGFGDRYVTITSCPYSVCKRYHTTAANKMQVLFSPALANETPLTGILRIHIRFQHGFRILFIEVIYNDRPVAEPCIIVRHCLEE